MTNYWIFLINNPMKIMLSGNEEKILLPSCIILLRIKKLAPKERMKREKEIEREKEREREKIDEWEKEHMEQF